MAICSIALGGNLGNTSQVFQQALRLLNSGDIRLQTVSRFFATPPMGRNAGDEFVNAAAIVETPLAPLALLERLHKIETELVRTREVHWGPRTLDLDLLLCDQTVICTERIVVPHPALWYRRFVLVPLLEIAADDNHPILRESIAELHERVHKRPLRFVVAGNHHTKRDIVECEEYLHKQFGKDSVRLSEDNSPNVPTAFANIILDTGEEILTHQQPPHEAGRTIRITAGKNQQKQRLQSALTDLCTAALGEVTLLN